MRQETRDERGGSAAQVARRRAAWRRTTLRLLVALVLLALGASLFTAYALAYPVAALPADNLIVNPWFRSASEPGEAGFDGWTRLYTEGVTWGLSQKESNPSPDIVISGVCGHEPVYCGTAARWKEIDGVFYPDIDVFAYQVVAADPADRTLKFFTYYVSHMVEVGAVNIYGSDSAEGPWTLAWVPLHHEQATNPPPPHLWTDTGFRETTLERGYPYYKVELQARLPDDERVGFKITGVYFATAAASAPSATPTLSPGATPTATAPLPTATPPPTATLTPASLSGTTMHVGDLDGSASRDEATDTWTAEVTVTIHGAGEGALAGATLSGVWDSGAQRSCTTGSSGQCTLWLAGLPRSQSSVSFSVTHVSHSTRSYDPRANHDPDGDSDGNSIPVSR